MSARRAPTHDVALTFDDGPSASTAPLLRALAACDVRATFFVMGSAALAFPDALHATLAAGHDVQLHCFAHRRHTSLTREELEADTDRALEVLGGFGVEPARWRTPWGVLAPFTEAVAEARGLTLTHWTADTEDWAGEAAPALLARVGPDLVSGAVVLMHDGAGPGARRGDCAQTVALVPLLVAAIRAEGLLLGTLRSISPPHVGANMDLTAEVAR